MTRLKLISSQSLKAMRVNSVFFQNRRQKMPYLGHPTEIEKQIYLLSSEEMPLFVLPLIKHALTKKAGLFFNERGAYPLYTATKFVLKWLNLSQPHLFSFKLSWGTNTTLSAYAQLGHVLDGFLDAYFPLAYRRPLNNETRRQIKREWRELPDTTRQQMIEKSPELLPMFKPLIETRFSRANLILALLNGEPQTELDLSHTLINAVRPNRINGVMYRFRQLEVGQKMAITPDDLGPDSPFRAAIWNDIQNQYPTGLVNNPDTEKHILSLIYDANIRFLNQHFVNSSPLSAPIIKPLLRGFPFPAQMIYVDDGLGSGNSAFRAAQFHQLLAKGPMEFCVFHARSSNVLPAFPFFGITDHVTFPEDVGEMFNFTIDHFTRHFYGEEILDLPPLTSLDTAALKHQFDKYFQDDPWFQSLQEWCKNCHNQNKIFTNSDTYTLDEVNRILVLAMANSQDPICEEIVHSIGREYLQNELKDWLAAHPIPDRLRAAFTFIEAHQTEFKIIIYKHLWRQHSIFKKKLQFFRTFFTRHGQSLRQYLRTPSLSQSATSSTTASLPILSDDPAFLKIAEEFYRFTSIKTSPFSGY